MTLLDCHELAGVSFRFDARDSNDLLGQWPCETSIEQAPGGSVTSATHKDPDTGLKVTVHARRFDAFPGVDWVVEFENGGAADTPIIEDILPLDASVPISPKQR